MTSERATIRILRLRPNARLPERQSEHASGYDLHACLEAPLTLGPMPLRVPTGIAVATPPGIDLQVRPRSGLFSRGVIGMLGTVDADYRGELHVTLYCLAGIGEFTVRDGDRIAQLVIARLAAVDLKEVDELDDTERGAGGHGSTGLR